MANELDDLVDGLATVERQVTEKLAQLHTQHAELQVLDYDADAKLLRPYLDLWMDWHLWAAYWLVLAKQARVSTSENFTKAWGLAVEGTREIEMASTVQFYGSFEERRAVYDRKTWRHKHLLDALDSVISTVQDFQRTIKTVSEHWDKRRVDTKWEIDRISRLPGSDYTN